MKRLSPLLDRVRRHLMWLLTGTLLLVISGCAEKNEQEGDEEAKMASCRISVSQSSLSFASPNDIRTVDLSVTCAHYNPDFLAWSCAVPIGVSVNIAQPTSASTSATVTVDPTALIDSDSSLGYALRVCRITLRIRPGFKERILSEALTISIDLPPVGGTRKETQPAEPRLVAFPMLAQLSRSAGRNETEPRFTYTGPPTKVVQVSVEGTDAAKFTLTGLQPPLPIGRMAMLNPTITFSGADANDHNTYQAHVILKLDNGASCSIPISSYP